MKKLMGYLKEYRAEAVMAPLFKMLEAGFELFVPLVMANIIDTGIKNGDMPYIYKMGGLLVLLGLVGLVCSLTAQFFAAKAAVGFGTALRRELFHHINHFSYKEIDREGTATLITRMSSDVTQVQNGVNLTLRLFLRSPFIVFGAMAMAFTIDMKSAMIFAVAIPLLSIVVFGIMLISMPLYKKVQKKLDQVLRITRENLTGIRVVRAFNRQEDELSDFKAESGELFRFQIFVGKISAFLNPLTYVIINLAIVALIYTGGQQVESGVLTQGEVVALVNYMSQILAELIKLANLIIAITKALACGGRVQSVLDTESGMEEKPEDKRVKALPGDFGGPKLRFSHVSFSYGQAKEKALSDIDFSVSSGETIGIIGGTGSGKSTLVNLIPRFYDVTEGYIEFDGADVRAYGIKDLRGKIGIVPQKAVLFKGTIRENMQFSKQEATDREIEEALKTAQAEDVVKDKKEGLYSSVLQGGTNLSGGQRQRLTIARALVGEPQILILDDSASALDFATDLRLRTALKERCSHMTVFIVSQRAATVRHADQILVLDDGRLAGKGTHEELFASCDVYKEICLSQLSKEEVQA